MIDCNQFLQTTKHQKHKKKTKDENLVPPQPKPVNPLDFIRSSNLQQSTAILSKSLENQSERLKLYVPKIKEYLEKKYQENPNQQIKAKTLRKDNSLSREEYNSIKDDLQNNVPQIFYDTETKSYIFQPKYEINDKTSLEKVLKDNVVSKKKDLEGSHYKQLDEHLEELKQEHKISELDSSNKSKIYFWLDDIYSKFRLDDEIREKYTMFELPSSELREDALRRHGGKPIELQKPFNDDDFDESSPENQKNRKKKQILWRQELNEERQYIQQQDQENAQ